MIYKIKFSSEEVDGFSRVFECAADATFLDLHEAILRSVGYPDDQMTSFFMMNEEWKKEQEVTLVEMESTPEYDNMTMNETRLDDLLEEQGQRLIYVFDPLYERYFIGALKQILPGTGNGCECVEKKGKAPQQLKNPEDISSLLGKDGKGDLFADDDSFGDTRLDTSDIDEEGFQDLSFEDGSMF